MDELNELLKQQAQELLLTPSPSVWMNVEADIARRERRRRWFLWLFLLVFLLSGVILYNVFAEKNRVQVKRPESPVPTIATGKSEYLATAATKTPGTTDKHKETEQASTPLPAMDAGQTVEAPVPAETTAPASGTTVAPVAEIEKVQPRAFVHQDIDRPLRQPLLEPAVMKMPEKDEMSTLQPVTPSGIRPVGTTVPVKTRTAGTAEQHTPKDMRPLQKEHTAVVSLKPAPRLKPVSGRYPVPAVPQQLTIAEAVTQPAIMKPAAAVPEVNADDTVVQEPVVQKPVPTTVMALADTSTIIRPLKAKKQRWSFSASMAPSLNFSRVTENNNDSTFVAQTRSGSKKLISANFSIAASYKVSPRLELYSGAGIRSLGERMKAVQNIYALDSGFIANVTKVVIRKKLIKGDSSDLLTNRFTYLEIPLGLRFGLVVRKEWGLYVHADVSASYLLGASGYYYNFEKRNYLPMDNERLKSWLLGYGAGVSLEYNLRKNIGIAFAPYFRNYPSSVYKEDKQNKLSQYFRQSGLQLSVRYSPGKK